LDLLNRIFNAGVVGAGGAGFPTHKKLPDGLRLLLINAAECEPLLCSDRFVMRNFAAEIVEALVTLKDEFKIPRVVIGTKKKYVREIKALKEEIASQGAEIEIHTVSSFYPAGDEQILIYEVTGETVPPGGIPPMLHIAVINVTTALNICRAMKGIATTRHYVTVNGAVRQPVIVDSPVGAKIPDVIKAAGGVTVGRYSVIMGGPMMGPQFSMDESESLVIGKTDGGIIVLPETHPLIQFSKKSHKHMMLQAKSACIQCTYCTEMCPRYLIGHRIRPNRIMRSLATGTCETDLPDALLCCECGVCELFACPMMLSPRKMNIYVKGLLHERGIKAAGQPVHSAQTEQREYRRISQSRIIHRLGLSEFPTELDQVVSLDPDEIRVPLKHGVGKPSVPAVKSGDVVEEGQVIAGVEFSDVGCLVHAPITGVVKAVDDSGITIKRREDIS